MTLLSRGLRNSWRGPWCKGTRGCALTHGCAYVQETRTRGKHTEENKVARLPDYHPAGHVQKSALESLEDTHGESAGSFQGTDLARGARSSLLGNRDGDGPPQDGELV